MVPANGVAAQYVHVLGAMTQVSDLWVRMSEQQESFGKPGEARVLAESV